MPNFSDYDGVLVNVTELHTLKRPNELFEHLERCFDAGSWVDVLAHGGLICLIGDPDLQLTFFQGAGTFKPIEMILDVNKDARPFEYKRVTHRKQGHTFENVIRKYLDRMKAHDFSLEWARPSQTLGRVLGSRDTVLAATTTFGATSYRSFLAVCFHFRSSNRPGGNLFVLPPTGRSTEEDDLDVLRDFFGVATTLSAPEWVTTLKLPGQTELEEQLSSNRKAILELEGERAAVMDKLLDCKRWFRLLYDDGDSLEEIVKQALELLGASVEKKSKEKDDYRVKVAGNPEGVMEVKGTHNPKFQIGPLRQLTHWVDEVEAGEQVAVKGIFIGNAARNSLPPTRDEKLFEPNGEDYAANRKGFVILRSMDLFCLVLLKLTGSFDSGDFWKRFFGCTGTFDASAYWERVPPEFHLDTSPT